IYNDLGTKVGKVEDLIISPERNVSYVIVGAGGFVGIGRHDVAVPVSQIQNRAGRLVMAGATKDTIKSLPAFEYANDTARRDEFIAAAEKDIANAKTKVSDLDKAAGTATADMKAKIDAHTMTLKAEMKTAEGKLSEMKMATVKRWREFEASVNAATGRLRKSTDKAVA
ncbi:MAG TPA: PRC-barrel domain-containing protein, partial [Casimicrobium sp.]|nr:PRC-barrel domain-containing protein [Casimicrobium sp.]